jgi:hypothetical protein
MLWIDAARSLAEVVDLKPFWNRAVEKLPTKPVGAKMFAVPLEFPVSVLIPSRQPKPASQTGIDVNLLSKTRRKRVKLNTFNIHTLMVVERPPWGLFFYE